MPKIEQWLRRILVPLNRDELCRGAGYRAVRVDADLFCGENTLAVHAHEFGSQDPDVRWIDVGVVEVIEPRNQ